MVLTVWLLMTPALGLASLPSRSRACMTGQNRGGRPRRHCPDSRRSSAVRSKAAGSPWATVATGSRSSRDTGLRSRLPAGPSSEADPSAWKVAGTARRAAFRICQIACVATSKPPILPASGFSPRHRRLHSVYKPNEITAYWNRSTLFGAGSDAGGRDCWRGCAQSRMLMELMASGKATRRFESQFWRRNCQTFLTGLSSGERDGGRMMVMFLRTLSLSVLCQRQQAARLAIVPAPPRRAAQPIGVIVLPKRDPQWRHGESPSPALNQNPRRKGSPESQPRTPLVSVPRNCATNTL